MYRNIVPSAVTQRVVTAFRAELLPACEEIATQGMPVVTPIAGLTPESVTPIPGRRVHGGAAVLDGGPGRDRPRRRVSAALDTVNALLGLPTYSKGHHHG